MAIPSFLAKNSILLTRLCANPSPIFLPTITRFFPIKERYLPQFQNILNKVVETVVYQSHHCKLISYLTSEVL